LAIYRRDNPPETLQEWWNTTIKEHAKWALIKASSALGEKKDGQQN
jgi:hypothetical protein